MTGHESCSMFLFSISHDCQMILLWIPKEKRFFLTEIMSTVVFKVLNHGHKATRATVQTQILGYSP